MRDTTKQLQRKLERMELAQTKLDTMLLLAINRNIQAQNIIRQWIAGENESLAKPRKPIENLGGLTNAQRRALLKEIGDNRGIVENTLKNRDVLMKTLIEEPTNQPTTTGDQE